MNKPIVNKPKIAFIDDEQRILRSLKMQFRQTHDVFITTNPDELIEYVRHNQVHVVVSDQRMPEKLGVEVLKEISQISPNTMRILLTGYADLNAVLDSVNEGEIYRYITKPWQNEELQKIVNKATDIAMQTKNVTSNYPGSVSKIAHKIEKRILVMDDDKHTYEVIKKHFEPAYKVHWANNLSNASTLLSKYQFGVAIADVMLNGENITPIIFALKNMHPQLMMLMLSGYKDARVIIDLINKGQIYRCLPRPTNLALLGISVERAFDRHEQLISQPVLAKRHHVEEILEEEILTFSDKIKNFLSGFDFWKKFSVFNLKLQR